MQYSGRIMQKQVDKSHYNFGSYIHKRRWASMWHQLDEVFRLKPQRVLEVGPGPGVFKALATVMGMHVETLDIDPELSPDHLASVFDMPFADGYFDVVCAFQMLEHLPFKQSVQAFQEMARVAKRAIIISLPDAATRWPITIHVPKFGLLQFSIPKPRFKALPHQFDGEHYWEIGKFGYSVNTVVESFLGGLECELIKTYRVHEFQYHRFFIFEKNAKVEAESVSCINSDFPENIR